MGGPIKSWSNDDIDVSWDRRLCIHIGECGRADNELFEAGRDPWCQPDLVQIGDAVDVVERCPTGALFYERKDGGSGEPPSKTNTVTVANNGPLYLEGDLQIDGTDDTMLGTRRRAALCRCGGSQNKPFCDNAHEKNGFIDRGAVGSSGAALDQEGGPLVVNKAKDGPLLVSGNLRIRTASGRLAWSGTKAALCRCGASKNKPFCDGAHKGAGFEAD